MNVDLKLPPKDIAKWLADAKRKKATHVIIVNDAFSRLNYPVYVLQGEDPNRKARELSSTSFKRVLEMYNLKMNIHAQLDEPRAFNP